MIEPVSSDRVEGFDLREFLPYLLNVAGEVTSRGFEKSYRGKYGMTRTEWRVLFHLGRYGAMTARDICDRSRTHKTKVSRAVRLMEQRLFLNRETHAQDRRFETLCLTTEGRAAYKFLCREAGFYDRNLSSQFTTEEAETLRRCLTKLADF